MLTEVNMHYGMRDVRSLGKKGYRAGAYVIYNIIFFIIFIRYKRYKE